MIAIETPLALRSRREMETGTLHVTPPLFAALLLAFAPFAASAQTAPPQSPSQPPASAPFDGGAWLMPFPKAPGDTFIRKGVHTGSVVTRADCESAGAADRGRFVYVEASGRSACIRYYLSGNTFPDKAAAIYLPGDKGGFRITWRNDRYEMVPEELLERAGKPSGATPTPDMMRKLGDPERNQSFAGAIAKSLRTPAIILARQGTDGSSGWVALRRTRWEVAITNRAIDVIKARHGIEKLHLVGQSGGGHLVGALSALRTDVACAVAGSAPLAFDPRSFYLSEKLPEQQRFFNPVDYAAVIAKKPGLRLMLVTDGRDGRVFVDRQAAFVRALAKFGATPQQFFVSAGDPMSHGVTSYSVAALRSCIAGKPDDEIGVELARMNAVALERRLKASRERQAREGEAKNPGPGSGASPESAASPPGR